MCVVFISKVGKGETGTVWELPSFAELQAEEEDGENSEDFPEFDEDDDSSSLPSRSSPSPASDNSPPPSSSLAGVFGAGASSDSGSDSGTALLTSLAVATARQVDPILTQHCPADMDEEEIKKWDSSRATVAATTASSTRAQPVPTPSAAFTPQPSSVTSIAQLPARGSVTFTPQPPSSSSASAQPLGQGSAALNRHQSPADSSDQQPPVAPVSGLKNSKFC